MITTTNKIINVCLYVSLLTFFVIAIGSCGKKEKAKDDAEKENIEAKKMLSGIWTQQVLLSSLLSEMTLCF